MSEKLKVGDVVSYVDDIGQELFEIKKIHKYKKLTYVEMLDSHGNPHDCLYPDRLRIRKRS